MGIMGASSTPKYKFYIIEEDGQVFTGAGTLMGLWGSADGANMDLTLHDSTEANNELCDIHVANGSTNMLDFTNFGGIGFATGLYADITGNNAEAFIWVDG